MKRILKYAGFTFLALIGLILVAVLVSYSYKKEILEAVNQKLKEEINGDINIGKLRITVFHDFPNVSLSLRDIYLCGQRYGEFHRDFLKAETININVEAIKLFKNEISIKSVDIIEGEIFIYKTKAGYTNLEIFKRAKKKDSTSNAPQTNVNFKNINLKNVAVTFHDSLMRKEFGALFIRVATTITPSDSSTRFHVAGDLKFAGLVFNAENGSFLKNKEAFADLNLEFWPHTSQFAVNSSSLKLDKSTLQLSGLFHLASPRSFQLIIKSDSVDYPEGVSVLPDALSSKLNTLNIEKKVTVNVVVSGSLIPGLKPAVDMTFFVNNSKVVSSKIKLEHVTLRGTLINHYDSTRINDDHNVQIILDTIHGTVKGIGFAANVSVQDFKDPMLNIKAKFEGNLLDLQSDTISEVKFKDGHFISRFSYQGKLKEYLDTSIEKYEGKLNGVVNLTGGEFEYLKRGITFEKLEATVRFTNEQCQIENISMHINNNPLAIKGIFTGYIPFFTKSGKKINATMVVSSPKLDLVQIMIKEKAAKVSEEKAAKKKRKIYSLIDELYKKLELELVFDIKKFSNKKFSAEDLTGKILLADNRVQVKGVKMKFAEGQVDFSASLNQLQRKINPFTLTAKVKHADIKKLFYAFNNFNQTTIKDDNLSGSVNVAIKLNATIDSDLAIIPTSLDGNVEFKLKKGRLKDFEPIQKIGTFLFKKRDLSDVQFGQIDAHFDVKGNEIEVRRMEVQSTVLTLYLEGRYSLKDSTNLSIQVPLSNLKSRD